MTPGLSIESFPAFVAAMLLLSLTPGPGFLAVGARALAGGFAAGLAAIAGLVVGDILFLVLGAHALMAARAGQALKGGRALAWLNRVAGGLLVGVGLAVATR